MAAGFVLDTPGLHLIVATVQWRANSSGGRTVQVAVLRSDVVISESTPISVPTPYGSSVMQATLMHVAVPGDVVQVSVKQTSGASLDVLSSRTKMQIARLIQ